MEERMGNLTEQPGRSWPPRSEYDLKLICLLVILTGLIRVWLICHTEVMARDGVGFVRYAWQLQHQSWPQVFRSNPHPPFYPITILAASLPLRHLVHSTEPAMMQLSAQLASAFAGILLVIPMFYLGKEIFDRRVGFWSAAIFQCLPVGSRVMADALSEGLFLFLAAYAVFVAVRAFRHYSVLLFGLSGLLSGLAYLTRPEGALIGAACGLVLLAFQAFAKHRHKWGRAVGCGLALTAGAVLVGGPYAAIIGNFTIKPTGLTILKTTAMTGSELQHRMPHELPPEALAERTTRGLTPEPYLLASIFATWLPNGQDAGPGGRLVWSFHALCAEIIKTFHYVAWLPALFGLIWFRDRLNSLPGAWVLMAVGILHTLVLWRVAYVAGYVADRHTLILVMGGIIWAVAGVAAVGDWLSKWAQKLANKPAFRLESIPALAWLTEKLSSNWTAILLLGLAGMSLPKALEPLHTNRAGHHAAGLWLAAHANSNDVIVDPFCWAGYYAGQSLREGEQTANPDGRTHYVVLGDSHHEHLRAPGVPDAVNLAKYGKVVYEWRSSIPKYKAEEVLVYCVPPAASTH